MHKQQKHLINCTTPQFQQLRHTLKDTLIHTQKQCDNKGRWPGSWHSALSSLYLDYIFMYFYFLGSPTGDSQNGSSGVNSQSMVSSRIEDVPSQSFMDGANRSHRNEEVGTGALWRFNDWKKERKKQSYRQWPTFILSCSILDVIKSVCCRIWKIHVTVYFSFF